MAVVAKVDIFDDETGKVYTQGMLVHPTISDTDYDDLCESYLFAFRIRIAKDPKEPTFGGDGEQWMIRKFH